MELMRSPEQIEDGSPSLADYCGGLGKSRYFCWHLSIKDTELEKKDIMIEQKDTELEKKKEQLHKVIQNIVTKRDGSIDYRRNYRFEQ
jgi:hypothetical protein